jgi:hypothetical protein
MMNGRNQKPSVVILVMMVISSLPILTLSIGGTIIFETIDGQQGEQQDDINSSNSISDQTNGIVNQYGAVVDSILNQTNVNQTGTAALLANLTKGDFESLTQDLVEARQALGNNDTTTVLDELNSASGELFQVISRQFDPAHVEAMTQEFNPLQTHLDKAQEAALKDNHTMTLRELSAAESELLKITQTLPSSQE